VEQFTGYVEAIKATSLKCYALPGNHDLHFAGGPENYQKYVGPFNYSFDHGGVHFVAYDSITAENGLKPTPWLLDDLAKCPPGQPVILLTHYQLESSFFNQLKQFNLVAVLSGHWHSSRLYKDGATKHFNSPPVSFGGIDFFPRSYRVFTWDGAELNCRTVRLSSTAAQPPATPGNGGPLKTRWTAPLGGEVLLGAPVVRHGRIYVSLMDEDRHEGGAVACWDTATGRPLWRRNLGSSVKSSVTFDDKSIFAVTVTGRTVALDPATGEIRWSARIGDPSQRWIYQSPTVADGRIFVGRGECFLALDAATGKTLWMRDNLTIAGKIHADWISCYGSPVVSHNTLIVGFVGQAFFYALDPASGETRWCRTDDSQATATPVPDGRGNILAVRQKCLEKLDVATGETRWSTPLSDRYWLPASPLLKDTTAYIPGIDGKVHAFDLATGAMRWTWDGCSVGLLDMRAYSRNEKSILATPQWFAGSILLGSIDGRLYALDPATGQQRWSHDLGVPVSTTPAVAQDTIHLALIDGTLRALRPA
jgi:outer membrane protein assembly factor BamB